MGACKIQTFFMKVTSLELHLLILHQGPHNSYTFEQGVFYLIYNLTHAFIKIFFILLMGRPILDLISLMVLKNSSLGSWYKFRFPVYKCHSNKNILNRSGTLYNLYRNECSTSYELPTHLVKATHLSIFISTFMLWSKTYLTAAIAWPISWTIVHSRRVLR